MHALNARLGTDIIGQRVNGRAASYYIDGVAVFDGIAWILFVDDMLGCSGPWDGEVACAVAVLVCRGRILEDELPVNEEALAALLAVVL